MPLILLACISTAPSDTGDAPNSGLYATPSPLLFEDTALGESVIAETRLHNDGETTVRIMDIFYEGPYDNVELSGLDLEPTRGLLFGVAFEPTVWGEQNGSATFVFDDGTELELPLEGTGLGAAAVLDPTELDFGEVPVGSTGYGSLELSNEGNVALSVTGVDVGAPFSSLVQTLELEPGDTAELHLAFGPVEPSQASETLRVESNGIDATARLTGLGAGE
ncbi:MAG: choice-of-anchor D domain-containing protein [Proteobacteria bacterium]|nr:choice-of-anchor D domain-containing protein [Pseudomonadota bacterium]MCP4921211.1 choice-of-anchor D domain-containing protein [Pseudomonadota bacterium]